MNEYELKLYNILKKRFLQKDYVRDTVDSICIGVIYKYITGNKMRRQCNDCYNDAIMVIKIYIKNEPV